MIGKTAGRGIKQAQHLTKKGKGDSLTFADLRSAANSINFREIWRKSFSCKLFSGHVNTEIRRNENK